MFHFSRKAVLPSQQFSGKTCIFPEKLYVLSYFVQFFQKNCVDLYMSFPEKLDLFQKNCRTSRIFPEKHYQSCSTFQKNVFAYTREFRKSRSFTEETQIFSSSYQNALDKNTTTQKRLIFTRKLTFQDTTNLSTQNMDRQHTLLFILAQHKTLFSSSLYK